jgi:hypothetical protein
MGAANTRQGIGTFNPMVHYGTDGAVNIFARHLALVARKCYLRGKLDWRQATGFANKSALYVYM